MADLVRPSPPVSWHDRVHGLFAFVSPVRLATGAGALLLVAVAAWWLLRSPAPPVEQSLPTARPSVAAARTTVPATSAVAPPTSASAELVVQAAGAVIRPGVYHLRSPARVIDLLAAAGGATPDADQQAVALAAPLVDGQRVYVPKVGEAVAPAITPPGPAPLTTAPPPVDINTATAEQLETLPGVGPAIAAAIVSAREQEGPFHAVDDLLDVRGIGPAKLAEIRDRITVG